MEIRSAGLRKVVGALHSFRWPSNEPNVMAIGGPLVRLALQTIRNIMASTLFATTSITMSSTIGVLMSSTTDTKTSALIYGNTSRLVFSIKYFAIYVFNRLMIDYILGSLNRASYFWSIRLRAFYISCPLFLWIFGPIPMFSCCCILLSLLYFLDTTSSITRELHSHHMKHDDDHELKDSVKLSQLTFV
ncbi:hypothetical protein MKW94_008165 [Papaver nudicaule]|uniref:Uncharacterized protein n=1 Tax=Papaver nudicaule TaxID=74823 RepID=A0AA41RMT6_PAPNU|nr:hypothetical protein [Papaver nudicaule]